MVKQEPPEAATRGRLAKASAAVKLEPFVVPIKESAVIPKKAMRKTARMNEGGSRSSKEDRKRPQRPSLRAKKEKPYSERQYFRDHGFGSPRVKAGDHPPYKRMVHDAIESLTADIRKGVTRAAIKNYIVGFYLVGDNNKMINTNIANSLNDLVENSDITIVEGGNMNTFRFRLEPIAKRRVNEPAPAKKGGQIVKNTQAVAVRKRKASVVEKPAVEPKKTKTTVAQSKKIVDEKKAPATRGRPLAKAPTPVKKSPVKRGRQVKESTATAKSQATPKKRTPAKKKGTARMTAEPARIKKAAATKKKPTPVKKSPVAARRGRLAKQSPVKKSPVAATRRVKESTATAKSQATPKKRTPAKKKGTAEPAPIKKAAATKKKPSPVKKSPVAARRGRLAKQSPVKKSPVAATRRVKESTATAKSQATPKKQVPAKKKRTARMVIT